MVCIFRSSLGGLGASPCLALQDPSTDSPPDGLSPCLGNQETEQSLLNRSTVLCAEGHTGPFCAVCKENYARVGETCDECWSPAASWVGAVVLFSVLISMVSFIIQRAGQRRSMAMSIIRVMLSWLQATSMLGTFRLRGPKVVTDLLGLSSVGDGISLEVFPVQCSFQWGFYTHYYVNLALPVLCYLIPSIIIWSQFCLKRYSADRERIANLRGDGFGLDDQPSLAGAMRPIGDARSGGLRGGGKTGNDAAVATSPAERKPSVSGPNRPRRIRKARGSVSRSASPSDSPSVQTNPLFQPAPQSPQPGASSDRRASQLSELPDAEEEEGSDSHQNENPLQRLRRLARNKVATATVVLLFLIHTRVSKVGCIPSCHSFSLLRPLAFWRAIAFSGHFPNL